MSHYTQVFIYFLVKFCGDEKLTSAVESISREASFAGALITTSSVCTHSIDMTHGIPTSAFVNICEIWDMLIKTDASTVSTL